MEQKQKKTMYERMKQSVKSAFVGAALGVAVAGCGRSGLIDVPADSGMQDSRSDIVKFDTYQPKPDFGLAPDNGVSLDNGLMPDSGVKPDSVVPPQYSYTVNNLIGDYLDRELLDRGKGLAAYHMGNPESSQNANPFSDGNGGSLGPMATNLNRINGNMFPPLATATLVDTAVGKTYTEQQDIWISGDSHYSDSNNAVVGKINSISYTLKFKGTADDFGIPVCTTPSNYTDYAGCKQGNLSDATEAHILSVNFLGDVWVVSQMSAPAVEISDEIKVLPGGSIKLAKEAVAGILNKGDAITVDDLKFQFDYLEASGNSSMAVFSVFDVNGVLKVKDKIKPGETKEFLIDGKTYRFHVYDVAPGNTSGTEWANVAIFSKELTLTHGQPLDPDNGKNKYWYVYLGWKNKGASPSDKKADHLRTIVLYADDISSLSSGKNYELKAGDYIPIPQEPVGFTFGYKGLSNGNHSTLKAILETTHKIISQTNGPLDSSGKRVACTITAPYVKVVSGATGSVFTIDDIQGAGSSPSASNNEFYVATSGAICGGSIGHLLDGSLFINESPSNNWGFLNHSSNTEDSVLVKFPIVGDGVSDIYKGIILQQSHPHYPSPNFTIVEKVGEGVSENTWAFSRFALTLDGANSTFNFDAPIPGGYGHYFKKDYVAYGNPGGPVNLCNPYCQGEEGVITDRGSQFVQMTDTLVEFKIAGNLVYSQFYLAKK